MRPVGLAAALLTAFAVGLLQGALLPNLPQSFAAIDLPLILAVWLAIRFDFREAVAVAIVAGLTRGTLSAMPAVVWAFSYAACASLVIVLFTRVFTNRSWSGLLGLTATAYVALHLLTTLARLAFAFLAGTTAGDAYAGFSVGSATAALATQLLAAALVYATAAPLRRAFGLPAQPR